MLRGKWKVCGSSVLYFNMLVEMNARDVRQTIFYADIAKVLFQQSSSLIRHLGPWYRATQTCPVYVMSFTSYIDHGCAREVNDHIRPSVRHLHMHAIMQQKNGKSCPIGEGSEPQTKCRCRQQSRGRKSWRETWWSSCHSFKVARSGLLGPEHATLLHKEDSPLPQVPNA